MNAEVNPVPKLWPIPYFNHKIKQQQGKFYPDITGVRMLLVRRLWSIRRVLKNDNSPLSIAYFTGRKEALKDMLHMLPMRYELRCSRHGGEFRRTLRRVFVTQAWLSRQRCMERRKALDNETSVYDEACMTAYRETYGMMLK